MSVRLSMVLVLAVAWSTLSVAGTSSIFGNVSKGKEYFSKRCAMCHGEDGRGNGGMAPDFSVEWDRLTKSDSDLAANIRSVYKGPDRGRYYSAMDCPRHPAISDDDMEDILAFLRRLAESGGSDGMLNSAGDFFDRPSDSFELDDGFRPHDGLFDRR